MIISPQPFRRAYDSVSSSSGTPDSPSGGRLSLPANHDLSTNPNLSSSDPSSIWTQHVSDPRRKKSEDVLSKPSPDTFFRSKSDPTKSSNQLSQQQIRRSFVPPVRDEEHEIQRKAHAKRVRETRRSTQGVTLEDLKSAEQLVKKKQQQENAQRTTELQQLASASSPPGSISTSTYSSPQTTTASTYTTYSSPHSPLSPPGSTATTTVTTSATLVNTGDQVSGHERRPSWRLRVENNDKSKFILEDSRETSSSRRRAGESPDRRLSSRLELKSNQLTGSTSPVASSQTKPGDSAEPGSTTPTQIAIQRKKKPKRRSTGVVQIDVEDIDDKMSQGESADEAMGDRSGGIQTVSSLKSNIRSQNGEVDYKKLWEESQAENSRLRVEMNTIKEDLSSTKQQLDTAVQASTKNAVSDAEKREKKLLERKLAEMEEELKQLQKLKAENEKLKSENRALTRVVSKLTAAASKPGAGPKK